ncbi:MAG: tonB-system energizer ExbB [Sulfitobacter sp.]
MKHTFLALMITLFCGLAAPAMAADLPAWLAPLEPYQTRLMTWLETAGHEEMSPLGMFMAADWVVKAVMLSLLFASLLAWVIFFAKVLVLRWSRLTLRRRYRRLDSFDTLEAAQSGFAKGKGVLGHMIRAAVREQERSGDDVELKDGIKERAGSEIARIEAGAARRMGFGAGMLANIGSTAPFVGLFGTVWGIMNSFISISESNTTNLAIVAPGIAEALLATAIGLVAAIPAVIFYNILARGIGGYKVMLSDAGALVERMLSRDLDLVVRPKAETPYRIAAAPTRTAAE